MDSNQVHLQAQSTASNLDPVFHLEDQFPAQKHRTSGRATPSGPVSEISVKEATTVVS